ncbi:hypothetical protein RJ641_030005 [Dillenia turbinata]|uniref:Hyaluronan/mRNA-binding protein domain-containing protein n=1 Tax=Dillenia turbinata TaxID=194707 RepID=A0AAN8VZB0_9MAGN
MALHVNSFAVFEGEESEDFSTLAAHAVSKAAIVKEESSENGKSVPTAKNQSGNDLGENGIGGGRDHNNGKFGPGSGRINGQKFGNGKPRSGYDQINGEPYVKKNNGQGNGRPMSGSDWNNGKPHAKNNGEPYGNAGDQQYGNKGELYNNGGERQFRNENNGEPFGNGKERNGKRHGSGVEGNQERYGYGRGNGYGRNYGGDNNGGGFYGRSGGNGRGGHRRGRIADGYNGVAKKIQEPNAEGWFEVPSSTKPRNWNVRGRESHDDDGKPRNENLVARGYTEFNSGSMDGAVIDGDNTTNVGIEGDVLVASEITKDAETGEQNVGAAEENPDRKVHKKRIEGKVDKDGRVKKDNVEHVEQYNFERRQASLGEMEEDRKIMTLKAYEELLSKKKQALEVHKTGERKVILDKDFESMKLVGKKNDDDNLIKLKSEKDKLKKKDSFDKEEKIRKSVSINEFLKPVRSEKNFSDWCGCHREQRERSGHEQGERGDHDLGDGAGRGWGEQGGREQGDKAERGGRDMGDRKEQGRRTGRQWQGERAGQRRGFLGQLEEAEAKSIPSKVEVEDLKIEDANEFPMLRGVVKA